MIRAALPRQEAERTLSLASLLTAKSNEKAPSSSLPHARSGRAAPPIVTLAKAGVQGAVGMAAPYGSPAAAGGRRIPSAVATGEGRVGARPGALFRTALQDQGAQGGVGQVQENARYEAQEEHRCGGHHDGRRRER